MESHYYESKPQKLKKALLAVLLLLVASVLYYLYQPFSKSEPPLSHPQSNPSSVTSDQIERAYEIVTASSTLTFDLSGPRKNISLGDLPQEIAKFTGGIKEGNFYTSSIWDNGVYVVSYRTDRSLPDNYSYLVRGINDKEDKLLNAKQTTLASLMEVSSGLYVIRVEQKLTLKGLTDITIYGQAIGEK